MADNFFEDKDETQDEVQKIKLGDTEFDPDELQQLVGFGKKLKEIEEKQGQPIDEVLTSWGERGRRLGEMKEKLKEYESKEAEANKPVEVKDKEALKAKVVNEAKEFGLLTKEEALSMFDELYQTRRSGEKILSGTNKVIKQNARMGFPKVAPDKLLEFMASPENPKDPAKAYKLMFEKEIDEIKAAKLASIKPKGMITNQESTAGSKTFERKSMRGLSTGELRQMFRDAMPQT